MKKIIIFFIIFSLVFSTNFSYSQTNQISLRDYLIPQCGLIGVEKEISQPIDEEQIKECSKNFELNFEDLKNCVSFKGIDVQCLTSKFKISEDKLEKLTNCLEEAIPMLDFAPIPIPGVSGPKFNFQTFVDMMKFQLMMEGINYIMGLFQDFLSKLGLFRKVPTNDQGAQGIIAKSIEETAKNFVTQLQTAINLGLQDVQNYLVFKIRSTIESLIYNKVIKNFVPDIQQYRFFRMSQAYTRAVDKILEPFTQNKNISCLPFEVKSCAYKLLKEATDKAAAVLTKSQYPNTTMRTFKSISRTKRFEILNKPNCDPKDPAMFQIYQALGLKPKITVAENASTLTSQIKSTQSLIAKVEINKPSLLAKAINIFANPFKSINLRLLLGQAGKNNNQQESLIDPIKITDNAIELANCNLIFNSTTEKIFKELEAEVDVFTAYTQEPGGISFMPKTSCLKTDAEAKVESLESQLSEVMKKHGTTSTEVQALKNTIDQYKKIAEQQRKAGVSGESPICIESKDVKNPISVYEDLREKITKGTLDFFEKREGATNVFVSFVRSWIDSELFKLIDKGFSEIYKENNDALFTKSNLNEAYSGKRAEELCSKVDNSGVTGLGQSCRNIFIEQRTTLNNIGKFELQNKLIEINKIFKLLIDTINKTSAYHSTMTLGLATITLNYNSYLESDAISILNNLSNSLSDLENISSSLSKLITESNAIFKFTQESLEQINKAFQELEDSTLAKERASTSYKINELENQIREIKNDILQKLNDLQSKVDNSKMSPLIIAANYEIENIKVKYSRDYYNYSYNFNLDIDGDGVEDTKFVLGKKEKLSFYKYFYPNLVNKLASINLLNLLRTQIDFDDGKEVISYPPFLTADLIKTIYFILYNSPSEAVEIENQQNLLSAIFKQFDNLFNRAATSSLTNEDLGKLKNFFVNLESVASRTLIHIDNTFSKDFPEDSSFTLLVNNNGSKFDFRESLENLINISNKMKNIIEISRDKNILNIQEQINELRQLLNELDNQYNKSMDKILREAGINRDELESNYNKIKEVSNQLTELDHQLIDACNNYNNYLNEAEAIINSNLRNQSSDNNPPPEEGGNGSSSSEKNNLGRRLALTIKNLTANIFEPINLLKPRKIQIK